MMEPEKSEGYMGGGYKMRDRLGHTRYSANLTRDAETGIGAWTEEQFRRALKVGIRPDGRPLRPPMSPRPLLSDDEVSALWAYLRSLPPIRNDVPESDLIVAPMTADAGQKVYYKYGCNSCHGDTGKGLYDLRKGLDKYETDETLIAYIKHPERTKPGVKMPTWDGVIEEGEYAPLARFVRSLAATAAEARSAPRPAAPAGG